MPRDVRDALELRRSPVVGETVECIEGNCFASVAGLKSERPGLATALPTSRHLEDLRIEHQSPLCSLVLSQPQARIIGYTIGSVQLAAHIADYKARSPE